MQLHRNAVSVNIKCYYITYYSDIGACYIVYSEVSRVLLEVVPNSALESRSHNTLSETVSTQTSVL